MSRPSFIGRRRDPDHNAGHGNAPQQNAAPPPYLAPAAGWAVAAARKMKAKATIAMVKMTKSSAAGTGASQPPATDEKASSGPLVPTV